MTDYEPLIPKHGGYRKLKTYQLAELIYDVTVRFCDCYVERRSRTHDQMVQAARSGKQNIAEGSQASGTSRKTELKLTNVARASLEELGLDYEDFLRQRNLPQWPPDHPALLRFKRRRCSTLEEVRAWLREEVALWKAGRDGQSEEHGRTDKHGQARKDTDSVPRAAEPGASSAPVRDRPCSSMTPLMFSSVLVANAALSLLNVCCHLLDRQLASLARQFEQEGGFTERLYRHRRRHRQPPQGPGRD